MVINIILDESTGAYMSYFEVLKAIEDGNMSSLYTHCTTFFRPHLLDKVEDVIVYGGGSKLSLKAVLNDKENKYIFKDIRRAHNTEKILLAGGFIFENGVDLWQFYQC